ncbi:hypothetical protein K431DRAFT_288646 [Polychaeton citri CBS 116435]|uniref:SIN1-domain-containing protein n=1 Tax=Polychaeton citri CBS 116435 TaxID=1314669 RepID=A0A9P4PYL1_9PEZI|nr:hypothetical protein K431DRAFT_288646 [Polychaeton citri CBS 116435]
MSLLLNEDFTTYQLRLGYLQNINDGVGERLINLNTAVLNNPAFRAAGWYPDNATIKRCYSPPIPTASIANEYFQIPPQRGLALADGGPEGGEGNGGMVTGVGSEGTLGPGGLTERRRRKRREQLEEDDSSDLSDDSEDESEAQMIKFNKMPVRRKSRSELGPQSSLKPVFSDDPGGPEILVTNPSRPSENEQFPARQSSLGTSSAIKQRSRRDTTTSSEMSSENELDPSLPYTRKLPGRPQKKAAFLQEKIQEEEPSGEDDALDGPGDSDDDDDDVGEASDLSDEFEGTAETGSMLLAGGVADSSPVMKAPLDIPPAVTPHGTSPRKFNASEHLPKLAKLPPGRPVSSVMPKSLLGMALKGGAAGNEKPFQRFAELSGQGESSPLWIKIYFPFSEKGSTPLQVPTRRVKEDRSVTVAELIGLALWRYNEEDYKPAVSGAEGNINRWTLRMIEDEEVDMDFPPLVRNKPVTDFTSNNNRPPQRRARDKPWDEFGLVKANDREFAENEKLTPQPDAANTSTVTPAHDATQALIPAGAIRMSSSNTIATVASGSGAVTPSTERPPGAPSFIPNRNPITGAAFAALSNTNLRKDSSNLLDAPQHNTSTSALRTGEQITVSIHFTDPHSLATTLLPIPTTTDTYIAELFDQACKRLNLDKALHFLRVRGTQTVAPVDRTVEALGDRRHLDLTRRRFGVAGPGGTGDGVFGLGFSGSPGSTSPNAPLQLISNTPPIDKAAGARAKKSTGAFKGLVHPLQAARAGDNAIASTATLPFSLANEGKRYNVLRKQPLSFSSTHPRLIIISPEYMTILPAASDNSLNPVGGKVTNVHMSSIVGVKVSRKHPKMVRVLVYREKETKRYDFEASTKEEASEIVEDVKRGLEAFGEG